MSLIHRWEKHHTTGNPPLGVWGYAACQSRKDIFYFGGDCGHSNCWHNSLFRLTTQTLEWNELLATNEATGPMKKGYCTLLAFDGHILTFGGFGPEAPINPSKSAKYESHGRFIDTNEHYCYDWESGEHHLSVVQYVHGQQIMCNIRSSVFFHKVLRSFSDYPCLVTALVGMSQASIHCTQKCMATMNLSLHLFPALV